MVTNIIPNEEAKVKFLSHFPRSYQSHIANIFFEATRHGGKDTPSLVALYVKAKSIIKVQDAIKYHNERDESKFKMLSMVLCDHLDEALQYASYCLWWESLPKDERDRIKNEKSEIYRQQWHDKGGA